MVTKKIGAKILFIFLFIFFYVRGSAQNSDYVIDINGIGILKIGMSQAEVEKMLDQRFVLRNALETAVSWQDSVTVKYMDISVLLFFQRQYTADKEYYMYLTGMRTSNSLCKTSKGIAMGDGKLKIRTAYKKDKISMFPEFDEQGNLKPVNPMYLISVMNESGDRNMIFYLRKNKVVAMEVMMFFTDEE